MKQIVELLERYDMLDHVYFMGAPDVMRSAIKHAPDIPRCIGAFPDPWDIVERGIKYGCKKVQLFKPYFNQEMIDKAHANGLICNVFWSDDPEETRQFLEMGIDTILTNDYLTIQNTVTNFLKER